jgi:hypothetical protein
VSAAVEQRVHHHDPALEEHFKRVAARKRAAGKSRLNALGLGTRKALSPSGVSGAKEPDFDPNWQAEA